MDNRFDIEDRQYDFNYMKAKTSKKRKPKNLKETGITKKDRLILKKWREKIVELNKKINEKIKNRKNCKRQSLAETLANFKKMRLSMKRRHKAKKQMNEPVSPSESPSEPASPSESSPEPVSPSESSPEPVSAPESVKEESASAPESPSESVKEESPSEESSQSNGVISTVTEGVKSAASTVSNAAENAAESIGLVKTPENNSEEKKGGRRSRKNKGKGKR